MRSGFPYAIGVAEPTSIMVETFGTEKLPSEQLALLVREFFDLRPYGLIQMLDLLHPIYKRNRSIRSLVANISHGKTDKESRSLLREAAGLEVIDYPLLKQASLVLAFFMAVAAMFGTAYTSLSKPRFPEYSLCMIAFLLLLHFPFQLSLKLDTNAMHIN